MISCIPFRCSGLRTQDYRSHPTFPEVIRAHLRVGLGDEDAIFAEEDLPPDWVSFTESNKVWFEKAK